MAIETHIGVGIRLSWVPGPIVTEMPVCAFTGYRKRRTNAHPAAETYPDFIDLGSSL